MAEAEATTISKATPIVINLGLIVSLIVTSFLIGRKVSDLETLLGDVAGRQSKYVGQGGLYTREPDELTGELVRLRERVIVLETTPLN